MGIDSVSTKTIELESIPFLDRIRDDFLGLDMIPRVGGGIGITRLLHAMNDYSVRQIVANM